MGFKDKLSQSYSNAFINRYGDRITQVQGRALSVKTEEKSFIGILNTIIVTIVVKQDSARTIATCVYKKKRWFKKPEFIPVSQGHSLLIQGLKPDYSKKKKKKKKFKDYISIMNVMNLTNKRDLVPVEGGQKKIQRVKQDRRFK
ncbi:hypothetical protein [Clostridium subterminale]|uniref:Uncharacterized protein n=1 Tax=Clostridium subterminale TaxID=1550 RepID=A0ABP3VRI7_CLOSU